MMSIKHDMTQEERDQNKKLRAETRNRQVQKFSLLGQGNALGQAYTKNKDKKSRAGLRGVSRSSRDRDHVEKEDSVHIVNNLTF